jgi:hypothetical protein
MPNVQIGNIGFKYVYGFQLSNNAVTPNTILDVGAGQARDSGNINDIILEDAVTIDFGVNGPNGLDTGSIGASKTYGIYVISSSLNLVQPAMMASLTLTGLTDANFGNAQGYDISRLVGYWITNGSSQLLKGYCVGSGLYRKHVHQTEIATSLVGGSATTLTAISMAAMVPEVSNTIARLNVDFAPATASDKVSFTPFGSTATVLDHVSGSVATKNNSGNIEIPVVLDSGVPKFLYINSAI